MSNDVDEEVYDNAGNERNEVREAPAGDRRTIANAAQAGKLDISGEAKMQENYVLLNRKKMLREWHTTRHLCSIQRLVPDLCCGSGTKFSAQTSCGEQDGAYTAEIPDRLHVHPNSGREQNSAMYHIRGNALWSGDQLHVRPERKT